MKTLIVYYSLEGNTKFIAEMAAKKLGADMLCLEPETPYPTKGIAKFFVGGKSSTFGEAPALKPYSVKVNAYDQIVLGTPVWAGKFAPPLRTFFNEHSFKGKRVAFFANSSSGNAVKCFETFAQAASGNTVVDTLSLVDPLRRGDKAKIEEKVNAFCEKLSK